MTDIAKTFFVTAVFFALCGMVWGIQMSVSQDHTLSPAHGHLNLIGFVIMAVYGTYYALTPRAARSGSAKLHYVLHVVTVLVLAPGIALAIGGQTEILAKLGSVLTFLSMAFFMYIVLKNGVGDA